MENKLILTNFPFKSSLSKGTLQEDEYGTLKNTKQFLAINENLGRKCLMSQYSLLELTTQESLEKILQGGESACGDDSVEVAKLFKEKMTVSTGSNESNICFMDMRGEQELKPEDAQRFDFLIFGGILGDHPPQDRSKELRSNFANVR